MLTGRTDVKIAEMVNRPNRRTDSKNRCTARFHSLMLITLIIHKVGLRRVIVMGILDS